MQKALAYGNYIINDGESFDDATITTVLGEGVGLPPAQAALTGRVGSWPLVSGVNRGRGRRMTLESHFLESTATLRAAKRRYLSAALNPELEQTERLIVADSVAPYGFVDGFGPWDTYREDAAWYTRSVLRDLVATVTGPIYYEDGPESRQRAVGILNANVNLVTNPSVETAVTNWTDTLNATGSRSTDEAKYGEYSYQVITDSVGAGEGALYTQAALTATSTYAFSMWANVPEDSLFEIVVDDTTASTTVNFDGVDGWQRVIVIHTMTAGETVATVTVQTRTDAAVTTFYLDAAQIELSDFPTIYCDGDQHGSVWSGTIHASTSNRGNTVFNLDAEVGHLSDETALTFRFVVKMPLDASAEWPADTAAFVMDILELGTANRIYLLYRQADTLFRFHVNGTEVDSAAQTFSAGDWLEIVITVDFDNSVYKLYIDDVVTQGTASLSPGVYTDWTLGTKYDETLQTDWVFAEFDVWDEALTATEITAIGTAGTVAGRARWIDAICEQANPLNVGGKPTDRGMISRLTGSGDVRWRSRDGDFWNFLIADDTDTMSITVDSDDDVYPVIRLEPQTAKTGGFAYKVFQAVHWKAPQSATNYPTLIRAGWDTATLTTAKMQADGDDLRVYVDGVEADRWLSGMDSASTNVWINMNWKPYRAYTLYADMGAGETASTVTLNESTWRLPQRGIVQIGTEYFVYKDKDNAQRQLTGVTRAAHDSTAAGHSADDPVLWIQHEVVICYGNSALGAPDPDDDYQPAMTLATSTNDSWVYGASFSDSDGKRTGRWTSQPVPVYGATSGDPTFFTASQDTEADPYTAMGIDSVYYKGWGRWYLYNPCAITTANFSAGSKYAVAITYFGGVIVSSLDGATWTVEYDIPAPAAPAGWEAWSRSETIIVGSVYVALQSGYPSATNNFVTLSKLDATAVTLSLNTTYTPDVVDGAEEANYQLAVTITNTTTDESILIEMQMAVDGVLEVDTALRTITYELDGTGRTQALTTVEGARRDWLRLVPGLNTLTWSDTGTAQLELTIVADRRYFE